MCRTARLVFPGEPGHVDLNPPESEPEEEDEDEEYEIVEGNPLADLPDDTEVYSIVQSLALFLPITGTGSHSFADFLSGCFTPRAFRTFSAQTLLETELHLILISRYIS